MQWEIRGTSSKTGTPGRWKVEAASHEQALAKAASAGVSDAVATLISPAKTAAAKVVAESAGEQDEYEFAGSSSRAVPAAVASTAPARVASAPTRPATQQDAGTLELGYAPPARSPNRALIVLAAGMGTSVLALVAMYIIDSAADINIMGYYLSYVIPIGALFVGMVASSGYGIASWKLGVKIRRQLLGAMVLLLLAAFFAAQYLEFRAIGPIPVVKMVPVPGGPGKAVPIGQLTFFEYFHQKTINWTWKSNRPDDRQPPTPLGMLGYVFQFLGVVGFCLGGAVVPAMLMFKPYCELCERYMNTRRLLLLPEAEGMARWNRLKSLAQRGDAETWRREWGVPAMSPKDVDKLQRRVAIHLVSCSTCSSGNIQAATITGHKKEQKAVKLGQVDPAPEFIREIRDIHT